MHLPVVITSTSRQHQDTSGGEHGYLLGADRLIDLLHGDNEEMRDEAVWALECISGTVLGPSPERWQSWWESAAIGA